MSFSYHCEVPDNGFEVAARFCCLGDAGALGVPELKIPAATDRATEVLRILAEEPDLEPLPARAKWLNQRHPSQGAAVGADEDERLVHGRTSSMY